MKNKIRIEGTVVVSLKELIENHYEEFVDLISTKLVGNQLLTDISYEVVGSNGDNILIKLKGIPGRLEEYDDIDIEEFKKENYNLNEQ